MRSGNLSRKMRMIALKKNTAEKPHSYIKEYADRIQSGEIVACTHIKQGIQRFLDDFKDPSLRIDLDESAKRIRFIENECKLYEAPFAGRPFKLELFQKALVESIYAIKAWNPEAHFGDGAWVRKYHDVLLVVGRKNGKAIALDTKIPTPDGWKQMRDIHVGDYVYAIDGVPAKVLVESPVRENHDCYRISFEDGSSIIADAEHLWTVQTKNSRRLLKYRKTHALSRNPVRTDIDRHAMFVTTTEAMLVDFVRHRHDGKGCEYKYRVPMNSPVEYQTRELPISPYALGVWLGDGESSGNRITVSAEDMDESISLVNASGEKTCEPHKSKTAMRYGISGITSRLEKLGLLNNKHIPEIYQHSSIQQRLELLQGLMDTDGTCSKSGQCEFTQKSKAVSYGIRELLFSLGIKNTIREKHAKIGDKDCGIVYRVQFFDDKTFPCFKMKRKVARLKDHLASRMKFKSITNIEPVPSVPVKCIGINHPSHLYLAGEAFTATHNTPITAAIALSEFVCGEEGTKILFASNDYDQADLAFSAADAMREESPHVARCTHRNQRGIFFGNPKHKKTHGKFSYQNKGSMRKISANGKNKEGRNIKVGVVDEVHEMADDHLIAPIRQALSTQDEPLYFEITTEGFTEDGYLDHRLADAQKVLDGELERPDWAIWWFSQDSEEEIWQDKSSWAKSNPGLGVIKKWSYLEKMVEEAKLSPSARAFVLAKDFNVKQNSSAAWLDESTITNTATFDPESLRGCYYIGGLDFAETTDLCSTRALFEDKETGQKYALGMYFVPEAKADALLTDDSALNPERKNYREWAKQGNVVICPGAEVDAEIVANWFVGLYTDYGMVPFKIGFDNWHSKDWQELIAQNFGKEVLERIGMDFMSLSGPMRSLESDLQRNNLNYNNNPVDRWCLGNTSYKTNNLGLIMPVKKYGSSKNRIDGTLSFIIAYAAYNRYKAVYRDFMEVR